LLPLSEDGTSHHLSGPTFLLLKKTSTLSSAKLNPSLPDLDLTDLISIGNTHVQEKEKMLLKLPVGNSTPLLITEVTVHPKNSNTVSVPENVVTPPDSPTYYPPSEKPTQIGTYLLPPLPIDSPSLKDTMLKDSMPSLILGT